MVQPPPSLPFLKAVLYGRLACTTIADANDLRYVLFLFFDLDFVIRNRIVMRCFFTVKMRVFVSYFFDVVAA